eukprot:Gb_15577 [translate_table: standard]
MSKVKGSNPIGSGVVSLHCQPEVLENLRAAINRSGGRMLGNAGHLERHGSHVQQHPRDVYERREEKNSMASEEYGEQKIDQFLHESPGRQRLLHATALAATAMSIVPRRSARGRWRRWRCACASAPIG